MLHTSIHTDSLDWESKEFLYEAYYQTDKNSYLMKVEISEEAIAELWEEDKKEVLSAAEKIHRIMVREYQRKKWIDLLDN